ncbi:MAG: cupin domain-containing protein [Thermoleophilia bacterium]|nr:cupin domain-containing protein [Thermoleophilia bacterium]MDH4339886.1 cupin domain-containing protein [Thermoleophilia bacterium]MDH5280805.1 cupin domain-containing protein [Thermoleophilia bacterium]
MSKASKTTASDHVEVEGYEGHFENFGPYTVGFETYTADADLAPFFVGLPDDRCQCPHMGYVLEGKVTFTYADGTEEMYEAGDAYYAPPGHTPTLYAGSRVVEFSPTLELEQTMEVVTRNMEAMGV